MMFKLVYLIIDLFIYGIRLYIYGIKHYIYGI
jgi:hypothetical protein